MTTNTDFSLLCCLKQDIEKYGHAEAHLINHIRFWLTLNQSKQCNIINGRVWMHQTHTELGKATGLTKQQVQRMVEKLRRQGVLITENHNKNKHDRTLWYSINTDETPLQTPPLSKIHPNKTSKVQKQISLQTPSLSKIQEQTSLQPPPLSKIHPDKPSEPSKIQKQTSREGPSLSKIHPSTPVEPPSLSKIHYRIMENHQTSPLKENKQKKEGGGGGNAAERDATHEKNFQHRKGPKATSESAQAERPPVTDENRNAPEDDSCSDQQPPTGRGRSELGRPADSDEREVPGHEDKVPAVEHFVEPIEELTQPVIVAYVLPNIRQDARFDEVSDEEVGQFCEDYCEDARKRNKHRAVRYVARGLEEELAFRRRSQAFMAARERLAQAKLAKMNAQSERLEREVRAMSGGQARSQERSQPTTEEMMDRSWAERYDFDFGEGEVTSQNPTRAPVSHSAAMQDDDPW